MDLYNASMSEEDEEPIELTHEQYVEAKSHYETIIERAESARRLSTNVDFVNLIMNGYLTNEPQRLAELMASGRLNEQIMQNCVRDIAAVGSFRNYMKMHVEQGNMAYDELVSLEEARDEALKTEEELSK